MKKTIRHGVAALVIAATAFTAGAQDSYNSLHPEFSSEVTVSSGLTNLGSNTTVKEVPVVSSSSDLDVDFTLKGSFSRASEWAVEKENGITSKSGIGYEAGIGIDVSKLYAAATGASSYSDSSDTNKYSLIQPMIDWYEANRAVYNLPASPFDELSASQPWPTTSYGNSKGRYQFINGTTVERADDVNWTSDKFDDALCLYNDIKYAINSTLDKLYCNTTLGFATGSFNQIEYESMSEIQQYYAQLRMKAKREFSKVASGTVSASTAGDALSSAYIKVTNIAGIADIRLDFAGKKLAAGGKITSSIAGQSTTGSALTFSLKNGLVQGLTADLALGIAGGEAQNPENYDTAKLDYYRGISGEIAARASARWMAYLEPIGSTLTVYGSAVASDLFVAENNCALDLGASFEHYGFVSYGTTVEAMLINYRNRLVEDEDYSLSASGYFSGNVGCVGASLSAEAAYKTKGFSHASYNSIEDRFYGYSLEDDYYIANLKSALMFGSNLEFNPQYFVGYDVVTAKAGFSGLVYGNSFAAMGTDLTATLSLQDLLKLPVEFNFGASYYNNSLVAEFADMSSLPERTVIDFTTISIGVTYKPVSQLEVGLEIMSEPSASRRNSERLTSALLNGTIRF